MQCCLKNADARRFMHAHAADWIHMTNVHVLHMLNVLMHGR